MTHARLHGVERHALASVLPGSNITGSPRCRPIQAPAVPLETQVRVEGQPAAPCLLWPAYDKAAATNTLDLTLKCNAPCRFLS